MKNTEKETANIKVIARPTLNAKRKCAPTIYEGARNASLIITVEEVELRDLVRVEV